MRGTFEASELLYGIESIFCKAAMARSVSPMRAAHGRTSEGAFRLCRWEKDGGGGSAGWKVAHRRRLEHDRSAVLRETGVGRADGLETRL